MYIKIWTIVFALILTSGCHPNSDAHQQKTQKAEIGAPTEADRKAEAERKAEAKANKKLAEIHEYFNDQTLSLTIWHTRQNGFNTRISFSEIDASKLDSRASLKAELLEQLNLIQSEDVYTPEIENSTETVKTPYIIVDCQVQVCANSNEEVIQQEIDDITQQIDTLMMLKQDTSWYAQRFNYVAWSLESVLESNEREDESTYHIVDIEYKNDQISIDFNGEER